MHNLSAAIWVRTILVLGYWVLGDIHIYWIVLLLGIFFHYDTKYDTDQTAIGTVHTITNLTSIVPLLSADDGMERVNHKVTAIHRSAWAIDDKKGGKCSVVCIPFQTNTLP